MRKIFKNREPPPVLRRSPNAGGGTKPPAPWHFFKERRGRDARGGGSPTGGPLRAGNLPLLPPAHRRSPAGGRSVSADLFKMPGADPHTGRTEQSPGAAVQPGGRHFQKRTAQSWAAAGHCKAGGAGRGQRPRAARPGRPGPDRPEPGPERGPAGGGGPAAPETADSHHAGLRLRLESGGDRPHGKGPGGHHQKPAAQGPATAEK